MATEDYTLPEARRGVLPEVGLPVVAGISGFVGLQFISDGFDEGAPAFLLGLALVVVGGLLWWWHLRLKAQRNLPENLERELPPLAPSFESVRVRAVESRLLGRIGSSEPLIIDMDGEGIVLPTGILSEGSELTPDSDRWVTIPWGQIVTWRTEVDPRADELLEHRIEVRRAGQYVVRAQHVDDNVALLDTVRSLGQREVRLFRPAPPEKDTNGGGDMVSYHV